MIEKIIHQTFLGETGEDIYRDFPLYVRNMGKWKRWAKRNGYEYRFYSSVDIEPYLTRRMKVWYDNLRYKWQRIDFCRYLILNEHGGVYIDLDIEPRRGVNFAKYLSNSEYVLNKWYNGKRGSWELNNALMGFPSGSLGGLIDYSIGETEARVNNETYKTWKVRYMLHTTGVRMFKRWCKMNGLTYSEDIHKYVKDHCTGSWLKNFK